MGGRRKNEVRGDAQASERGLNMLHSRESRHQDPRRSKDKHDKVTQNCNKAVKQIGVGRRSCKLS